MTASDTAASSGDCLERNAWICGEYVSEYWPDIATALRAHVVLTVVSVVLGMLIAFPLALLVRRWPRTGIPVIGSTTVLYTIPSLAMFAILQPWTGLDPSTVVIGLTLYSLTILVGNMLAGLRAVPADAVEAARGMGYGPVRLLFGVELPLALPTIMAGLRVATVSTVALTTVGAVVGSGGLGNLIQSGIDTQFKAQVLTASVLCVLLAIGFDLLLLLVQRLLTPWERTGARRRWKRDSPFVPGPTADVGIDDTRAHPKAVA
ncbi:ABC transporter permease [Yinghuangia sp. YIM S09857]|uniref:ABC transporter permease n=1 Tax=Yinghuangia sp. YIM S09857 TaxID=3436929 RepID=UPI003F532F62